MNHDTRDHETVYESNMVGDNGVLRAEDSLIASEISVRHQVAWFGADPLDESLEDVLE